MEELAAPAVERWLPVVGYEGLYSVSDQGRVRSEPHKALNGRVGAYSVRGCILKPWESTGGYPCVALQRNGQRQTLRIHPMVLAAFVGPPPIGHQACHYDGNVKNNSATNLRWDSASANQADRRRHGTHLFGETANLAKLHDAQVREILESNETQRALAKRYGVAQTTISQICSRKTWTHINLEESK